MKDRIREQLNEYNSLFREMDHLYGKFARSSGLPEAAFWILYTLREMGSCTQTMIYQRWAMGKQTINNEVRKLADAGLIAMLPSEKDRRSKLLSLTDQGQEYVRKHIDVVFAVEEKVFEELPEKIREELLESSRVYTEIFRRETLRCLEAESGLSGKE
jgi:DNA-binding MarR family transcriptional regulator